MNIQHEEYNNRGRFFLNENGEDLAEMTYSRASDEVIIIEHTEVDPSLKGQGVANLLLDRTVEWARENNLRILPVCPFAKTMMERHKAQYEDVLAIHGQA